AISTSRAAQRRSAPTSSARPASSRSPRRLRSCRRVCGLALHRRSRLRSRQATGGRMKLANTSALTALAIALAVAPLAGADPPPSAGDPKIAFERYQLPNGLEVILAPEPSVPLVAVNIWYHVGSGYEVPGRSGFAHLFEHMMFQGSKHVGEDKHFDILRNIG